MNERAEAPALGEWQASDDGSHIYSDRFETDAMLVLSGNFGSVAKRKRYADQIAHDLSEAAALRAALDQERADNERLRAAAHSAADCIVHALYNEDGLCSSIGEPALDELEAVGVVSALLSGRGEGHADG